MEKILGVPANNFWSKVEKTDDCWIWTGAVDRGGYGVLWVREPRDVVQRAHRISYLVHIGPIPDGLFVCHHCDNRRCVRPDHLFAGDHRANMTDMWSKGRGTIPGPQRANRYGAKLTPAQVEDIRARYAAGEKQAALAAEYGVRQSNISMLVNGHSWSS